MTYKEAYTNCKTFEEFKKMVEKDIKDALIINPDRVDVIKKFAREAYEENGGWD